MEFDFADEALVVGADVGEDEFLAVEGVEGVCVEVALGEGLDVGLDVSLAFDGGLVGVEGAEGSGRGDSALEGGDVGGCDDAGLQVGGGVGGAGGHLFGEALLEGVDVVVFGCRCVVTQRLGVVEEGALCGLGGVGLVEEVFDEAGLVVEFGLGAGLRGEGFAKQCEVGVGNVCLEVGDFGVDFGQCLLGGGGINGAVVELNGEEVEALDEGDATGEVHGGECGGEGELLTYGVDLGEDVLIDSVASHSQLAVTA